jgi:hypothetical protein
MTGQRARDRTSLLARGTEGILQCITPRGFEGARGVLRGSLEGLAQLNASDVTSMSTFVMG